MAASSSDDDDDSARALALRSAPPKLKLAESLADRRPGEIVAVDQQGHVIGRRTIRRRQAVSLVSSALIVVAMTIVFGPAAAIGGAIGAVGVGLVRTRRYRKIRRALALVASWRNDEARVVLVTIQGSRAPRPVRMSAERLLGVVAWRAGAHKDALGHVEMAHALATAKEQRGLAGHLLAVMRIGLLIELDVDQARALRPQLERLPDTELFIESRRAVALDFAFRIDRAEELPDDVELHDWARAALGENESGLRLGLLAWAFDRRGDAEMRDHLLGQVGSHLQVPLDRFAAMSPRLHAWLAPRIAALPPEDD